MGSEVSKDLQKLNVSINSYHTNIDSIYNSIIMEGSKLITDIQNRGYLDNPGFCQRIGYLKTQELKDFFPIQTLQGVQYRM